VIFECEKEMQAFLWDCWAMFRTFPPVGFLRDLELVKFEWWTTSMLDTGRADFLAYDRRLAAHVVVELKNHALDPGAVAQVAGYIWDASERVGPTYGLLMGPGMSDGGLRALYSDGQPLRAAFIAEAPKPGTCAGGGIPVYRHRQRPKVAEVIPGYLRDVFGDPQLPDGNPAMADFVAERVRALVAPLIENQREVSEW
jgi:hypothetical protein